MKSDWTDHSVSPRECCIKCTRKATSSKRREKQLQKHRTERQFNITAQGEEASPASRMCDWSGGRRGVSWLFREIWIFSLTRDKWLMWPDLRVKGLSLPVSLCTRPAGHLPRTAWRKQQPSTACASRSQVKTKAQPQLPAARVLSSTSRDAPGAIVCPAASRAECKGLFLPIPRWAAAWKGLPSLGLY